MSSPHVALQDSNRPIKSDARRLRDADPSAPVEITVSLRGPQLPDADHLPSATLSREQFETQFGARREDVEKAQSVFEKYGLTVEDVSLRTRSMRISGTVASMEKAFQPHLGIYKSKEQGEYRGREGEIQIPTELLGVVTGVFGLDERRVARRKAVHTAAAPATFAKMLPFSPPELQDHYNFPPGTGEGQQIVIAEFEGAYFQEDLAAFCKKYSLPMPKVTSVPVGFTPLTLPEIQKLPPLQRTDELDASIEVNMDVQIVAGLCPQSEIFIYFAPFTQKGWVDMLNQIVTGTPAKPVALSISWGLAEDAPDWSAGALRAINERLQAAAMIGITVCVSSGDDGSGDDITDGRAHVDFPSSSPFVLSVGGTMLNGSVANSSEQAWWENPGERTIKGGGATGGGVSVVFSRPKWQSVQVRSLNTGSIDGRVLPDVAALAGPPFYDLIFMGRDFPNGGTSASTPLWAALVARINANIAASKKQRFLPPLLYQNGANGKPRGEVAFRDITAGQNASYPDPGVGYQAHIGYDAVTGWGVPDGSQLLKSL
jgi:kumamolisin